MTGMFSEGHKSVSTLILCYTLCTVLQHSGGLCQETFTKNTETDRRVGKEHPQQSPHPHGRMSRSPSIIDPSSASKDGGGGSHLFPPMTLNKLQTRLSQFHGNSPQRTGGGQLKWLTRNTPEVHQPEPQTDGTGFGEQEPTFTPFISARALSNMPEFFDYLKANLAALKQDEMDGEIDPEEFESGQIDDDDFELGIHPNDNGGGGISNGYPEHRGIRFPPVSFYGGRTRNLRKYFQEPRNVYEFGLG